MPAPQPPREGRQPLREGQRHTALTSLAGKLLNAGLGTPEQVRAALHAANREQCDPPLPESEVDAIATATVTWNRRPSPSPREQACPDCGDEAWSLPGGGIGGSRLCLVPGGTGGSPVSGGPPPHDPAGHATHLPGFINGVELGAMVRATSWLWPGWIADEHITVLAGESGAGKSWLALALARCVAQGLPWPDGRPNELEPGRVFWLESEGRLGVLHERLTDLGLDREKLCFMREPYVSYYLDRPRDYEAVVDAVTLSQPRALIVDAWSKSLAGSENDADVRFCLDDLQSLARTLRIPIVLIHHLRKKQLTDYAEGFDFDRLRGSSVLSQVATCIIGVDQAERGVPHCRVSCGKANLAPLPEPFGFTITGGFRSGAPAQLIFGPPPHRDEPTSRLDEAKAFLRQALANGPRPANEVKEEAKEEGISEHTLRRARADVCVAHRQPGSQTKWLWALNVESQENVG